jgi:hypothetical protein
MPPPTPGYKFFLYAHVGGGHTASAGGGLDDFLSLGPVTPASTGEEGCFCAQLLVYQHTQEVQVTVKATPSAFAAAPAGTNSNLVIKCFLDKIVEAFHPLHPQIV